MSGNPYPITCSGQTSVNYTITYFPGTLTVTNTPPSISAINGSVIFNEGTTALNTGAYSDVNNGDIVSLVASVGTITKTGLGNGTWSWSYAVIDGPAQSQTVTITAIDLNGGITPISFSLVVNNVAPAVTITAPILGTLYPINSATVNLSSSFVDPGTLDTHTCTINWDDGAGALPGTPSLPAGSGTCTGTHTYSVAGVYTIQVSLTDKDGGVGTATTLIVVYDPSGGFVTGGGWILSPTGAYTADPSATGKANFGFVSKYQKGATVPTGQTEFQFQAGGLNFHSEIYQWLVISGAKAQYKGTGTVNNQTGYGFLLTATDGNLAGGGGVDKFRIKVWRISDSAIIYDNAPGSDDIDASITQALGGGSIVIHK